MMISGASEALQWPSISTGPPLKLDFFLIGRFWLAINVFLDAAIKILELFN